MTRAMQPGKQQTARIGGVMWDATSDNVGYSMGRAQDLPIGTNFCDLLFKVGSVLSVKSHLCDTLCDMYECFARN